MALNIKNAEVERLAAEVADLCGETKTEAIRKSLEERKARLQNRVAMSRGDRARRFLKDQVWPRLQGQSAPGPSELDSILGYGPTGI